MSFQEKMIEVVSKLHHNHIMLVKKIEELENKIIKLEEAINFFAPCNHKYRKVGFGDNSLQIYYNSTNAYHECEKCDFRLIVLKD